MFRYKVLIILILFGVILNADGLRKFFLGKFLGKHTLLRNSNESYSEKIFTQILDHFDPTNTASFKQKYFVQEGNSTIAFLMINGEGPMTSFSGGQWETLANEVGAWRFQLEHRYYGESQPFNNLSTENLRFLSSDQALADCANFIATMNEKYNFGNNAIWIAFGGSYAGSLAAWVRYKYPHLVHAAVSSSGPLEAKLDFGEYLQVVAEDLRSENESCLESIQTAFSMIASTVENGGKNITKTLRLCEDFTPELSRDPLISANFYSFFTSILSVAAQYDGLLVTGIYEVCYVMKTEDLGDELDRFGIIVTRLLSSIIDNKCIDFRYDSMVDELKNESLESDAASGSRQWAYQTCTEFGFYQTTSLTSEFFGNGVTLELYSQLCKDVFGNIFTEEFQYKSINKTNILKGAKNLEVSNVIFVHGSRDPWHALGVTESSSKSGPAILINGTSHCIDMYDSDVIDSPALQQARETIRKYVLEWIFNQ